MSINIVARANQANRVVERLASEITALGTTSAKSNQMQAAMAAKAATAIELAEKRKAASAAASAAAIARANAAQLASDQRAELGAARRAAAAEAAALKEGQARALAAARSRAADLQALATAETTAAKELAVRSRLAAANVSAANANIVATRKAAAENVKAAAANAVANTRAAANAKIAAARSAQEAAAANVAAKAIIVENEKRILSDLRLTQAEAQGALRRYNARAAETVAIAKANGVQITAAERTAMAKKKAALTEQVTNAQAARAAQQRTVESVSADSQAAASAARRATANVASAKKEAAAYVSAGVEQATANAKRVASDQVAAAQAQAAAARVAAAQARNAASTQAEAAARTTGAANAERANVVKIQSDTNAAIAAQRAAAQVTMATVEENAARARSAAVAESTAAARSAAATRAAVATAAAADREAAAVVRAAQAAQRAATMTTAAAASNTSWSQSMTRAGSQAQWIGKQLSMNLTAPLALVAGLGVKFGLDFEKAMTRVNKVYGDSTNKFVGETKALEGAFVALSNKYGVQADEVANVAAEWAAAGSSGLALAKQTELTMQTMILGEMDAADATKALVAIQAQWGAETSDVVKRLNPLTGKVEEVANENINLTQILRQLNAVENETGTTMQDLVTVYAKASASARTAGVSTQELAALTAALVPAAGGAAEAGNALKSIFNRLSKPTKDTNSVLEAMNINLQEFGAKTGTQKLEMLAAAFNKLPAAQQNVVSGLVAGGWQVNRFSQIMMELNKQTGYYRNSLKLLADQDKVTKIAEQELNAVLTSNPQKLKQAGVIIQNSLMKAMVPLIPVIVQAAQWIGKLAQAFANLPTHTRSMILAFGIALAVLGPIIIFMGLLRLSIGQLAPVFMFLARAVLLPIRPVFMLAGALGSSLMWGLGLARTGIMSFFGVLKFLPWAMLAAMNGMKIAAMAGGRAIAAVWAVMSSSTLAIQKAWAFAMLLLSGTFWKGMIFAAGGGAKKVISVVLMLGRALPAALASPWVLAIAAVIAILVLFKDQIKKAIRNVIAYFYNLPPGVAKALAPVANIFEKARELVQRAFNALPAGIKNALLAVVRIVRAAAMKVYELFSYLNPFARHSPSLVENVTGGMGEVNKQFANSAKVAKDQIGAIHSSIKSLDGLSVGLKTQNDQADHQKLADNANKAGVGNAMPQYDKLKGDVDAAKVQLAAMNTQVKAQEAYLKNLQKALDAYDQKLENLNAQMETTRSIQDTVSKALDRAKQSYDRFANAQIAGSRAADDAIFANQQAQKQLQLEIAKMEDSAGSVDSVTDAYSKLQGEIESLQAKQKELRSAGAGSDVTGVYDDLIAKARGQQGDLTTGTGPAARVAEINKELAKLQKQAEVMDLEKSLKFDGLNRQLDQFKNNVQEMPFGQIMDGMAASRNSVNGLQNAYDVLGIQIDGQQRQIDSVQKQRDALQKTYDNEDKSLQFLNESYQQIEETIRDGEQALTDFSSAAEAAVQRQEEAQRAAEETAKKLKGGKGGKGGSGGDEIGPGLEAFNNAAGGDYETFGGNATIGREGDMQSQVGDIDAYIKELTDGIEKSLGGMNPFAPLKNAWNNTVNWFKNNTGGLSDAFSGIGISIGSAFDPSKNENIQKLVDTFQSVTDGAVSLWHTLETLGKFMWDLFGSNLVTTGKELFKGLVDVFKTVWPEIVNITKELGPFISTLAKFLMPAIGALLLILKVLWSMLNGAIGPVFSWIGDILRNVVMAIKGFIQMLTGAMNFLMGFVRMMAGLIKGIFTGDFSMFVDGFKQMIGGLWTFVKGIWSIISATWNVILSTIKSFAQMIWNVVWGFVEGIIKFFWHLWNVLVGHSIVPDMINAIIEWFFKLPGQLLGLVEGLINSIVNFFVGLGERALAGIGDLGSLLWGWLTGAWNFVTQEAPKAILGFLEWFGSIEWKVIDAIGGLAGQLVDWLKGAWQWVVDHGGDILVNFLSFITGIPRSILEKLGNAAFMLYDWGKNLIQGLLNGAGSLLSKIGEFFLDKIPGWIKEPFKKAMGIHSPSRVFAGYGVNLGEGLILGMESMQPAIEKATDAMAASADIGDKLNVSANADTSSVVGAVADISRAMPSSPAVGVGVAASPVDDPTAGLDLDGAAAELDTFIAESNMKIAAFTTGVIASFATIPVGVAPSFTALEQISTSTFTLMQTSAVTIVTTMVTTINGQLTLLIQYITAFGETFNAAWNAAWELWKATATGGVDHTLSEWDRLSQGMASTLESGIRPVFDEMTLMLQALEDSFTKTVDNVGTTWDKIKEKTAAPGRFVINDVYNDGIRGAWNQFNKFLDLDELPEFKAKFAAGGGVFGPGTGTSDSIPAMLSRGEHVITAKEVQAAGGHAAVMQQRQEWLGKVPAFARGGPVDLNAAPWPGGGGESNLKPAAILARRNVHKYFPEIQTIGGYRPYDAYPDHPSGLALDIMVGSAGNPIGDEINDWLHSQMFPLALNYTIWKQFYKPAGGGGNLMEDRGSITQNHYDHIHALFNANGVPGIQDGGVGGGTAAVFDYRKMIGDSIKAKMDEVRKRDPKLGGGIGKWPMKSVDKGQKMLEDFLLPKADKLGTSTGPSGGSGNIAFDVGAGTEQWRKLATEMLIMQGESPNYTQRLLMQMNTESSGNPNAINLWDSNAQKGTPSKGLMQVIDPTFATYRDPRLPNNIWDPAANIAASIRYSKAVYGSLETAWQGHGYDSGGLLQPGQQMVYNATGGPEPVLTGEQWSAMYTAASNANTLTAVDIEQAMTNANIATENTGDAQTDALIKGMDVWQKSWSPAVFGAAEEVADSAADIAKTSATASTAITSAADKQTGATDFLSKSIGKYNDEINAFSKVLAAVGSAVSASVQTDDKGNVNVTGLTFESISPLLDALGGFLDTLPYAERDWQADNPVAGETKRQRWMRQSQNNLVNFGKGTFNILRDVGAPILKHTAIIGTAVEKLVAQDGAAWTAAIGMISAGNPAAIAMLVPLILKALATLLPLILNAILDIVPAIIRAIIRFLTKFMPDSVFAYADMASAEAAVKEQQGGGATAQGQGQRYPTDAMRDKNKANSTVNLNVYGDLSFPNISNGDDAEDFIYNLKVLSGS